MCLLLCFFKLQKVSQQKNYESYIDWYVYCTHTKQCSPGDFQIANKIIVMDKGNIIEIGKHDDLINNNAIYKKLYNLQFKEKL